MTKTQLTQTERQTLIDVFRSRNREHGVGDGDFARLLRLAAPNMTVGLLELVCDYLVDLRNVGFRSDATNRITHLDALRSVPKIGANPFLRFINSRINGRRDYVPRQFIGSDKGIKFHVCPLSSAFITKDGLDIVHSRHDEWFRTENNPPVTALHRSFGDWAVNTTHSALSSVGEVSSSKFDQLVKNQATQIAAWFDAQRANLAGKKAPKLFVSGTIGMALNRTMAEHVRESGGQVIATDHGNGIGMWATDMRSNFELDWPHKFVTFGPEMAKGASLVDQPEKRLNPENRPSFDWAACGKEVVRPKADEASQPECDVVQIAAPHIGDRASIWPYYSNETMLNWQDRLHTMLAAFGCRSAVKLHPESFHPKALEIAKANGAIPLTAPFEKIAWENQVMIFEAATTVLRDALRYGLPIVFVELPRVRILDHARTFFEKRAALIRGWIDQDGEIQVDPDELREAIKRAPSLAANREMLDAFFPIRN